MGIESYLILLFIFDIGLMVLIFSYNTQGVINRFLSLLMLPITLTNLEMLLLYSAGQKLPIQIGFNIAIWGITFFFPLFYHFSFYFPRKDISPPSFLFILYMVPITFGILHMANSGLRSELSYVENFPARIAHFKGDTLFLVTQLSIFIYITSLFIITTRRLILSLKKPIIEKEKNTVIMILTGFLPLSLVLLTTAITFIPFRGGIRIYIITSIAYTIYFIILIIRFGFFEGKTFFRYFILYPVYAAFLIFLYGFLFKKFNQSITAFFNVTEAFLLSIEIALFFLIIFFISRFIEHLFDSAVSPASSNLHEGIKAAQSKLVQLIDLFELTDQLDTIFIKELKLKQFYLLFHNIKEKTYQNLSRNSGKDVIAFPHNGELADRLKKEKKILNIQQIAISWRGGEELELLDAYQIHLVLPLFTGDDLVGISLFGVPGVVRTWHKAEIEELELLGVSLPMIIERCRTHERAIEMEKKQARVEKFAVLNEITSGVAHEIRNPLSIISTSAETIALKNLSEEEIKKLAGYIQEETGRVSRLLNKILSIAPLKSNRTLAATDVKQIVAHTFELLSGKAQKKNISLKMSMKVVKAKAFINPESLTQICLNIILNAIEAAPVNGYILALIDQTVQGYIDLRFINNGEPIEAELQKQLFDPFITTKRNGTGLGLPVSLRLVREANGSLKLLKSSKETVFQILIPAY